MTPQTKIKWAVINRDDDYRARLVEPVTEDMIEELYEEMYAACDAQDILYEFREGDQSTKIRCESSRHYDSCSVGSEMPDGTWVGWTYWSGGGKHGEPEGIDWISEAYDLSFTEETKMVTIKTFTKAADEANL